MRKTASVLVFLFQLFTTFAVLFTIYIIYAAMDVDEVDMITGMGFLIFQPFFGGIITTLTIAICLVVGLPIRLKRSVSYWWQGKPLLPVLGGLLGILFLLLAFHSNLTTVKEIVRDETIAYKEMPNSTLTVSGWFLTAFSLLHFYPQAVLKKFLKTREISNI